MEIGELTEYEQERTPQETSIDTDIAISPRSLYREMICPICKDILSQTRAAPDCLHRFCTKCIDKVLKKECPVCRKKLPSQLKSFRADPKFDQLIAKIFSGYRARSTSVNSPNTNSLSDVIATEFELILRPLNGSRTRFIKCPHNTTVDHLAKYLAIRPEGSKMPNLDNDGEYKLCIVANRSEGQYQMLDGNLRLEDIRTTYKLGADKPMELYFYNPPDKK